MNAIRTRRPSGAAAAVLHITLGCTVALAASAWTPTVSADVAVAGVAGATAGTDDGFDCLIVPGTVVEVGVESQGVVDEVLVERGERVRAEQTLALLRSGLERASLDQALERVSMDSEIAAREADLEFNRQVLARKTSLLAQKLAPQQEVDEARARYRVAEAALRRAHDNAVLDRHEALRQEALLRQRIVTSPIDGVVLRRHSEPGELVIDTPIVTVADLDTLGVEVVLPASELRLHRLGERVRVHPETAPDLALDAIVSAIDPMLDAASGTFGLRLELDNADGAVVAGQECRARFARNAPAG